VSRSNSGRVTDGAVRGPAVSDFAIHRHIHVHLGLEVDEVTLEEIFLEYDNIKSQLYATVTNFIYNYNQLDMFRAIISPILRSTRLCLQVVV
jgi:hypothetical protein